MVISPVPDMLIRIKNAGSAEKKTVVVPYSKMKMALALLLEKNGLLINVEKIGKKVKKTIEMDVAAENQKPFISEISIISKPSRRVYASAKELRKFYRQRGITVVSTSKGLMTAKEAKEENLGGEVICRIL